MPVAKKVLALSVDNPILTVGERSFVCTTDKLPFGTLLRYAENDLDLMAIKRLLAKVLSEEDLDEIFDIFDQVGVDDASESIRLMIAEFTERPTKKP